MRNFIGNTAKVVTAIVPKLSAAETGVTIDIKGFDSAILHCNVGAVNAGALTSCVFTIQEGSAVGGGDKAPVAAAILPTSTVTVTAVNSNGNLKLDLRGVKRYVTITSVATVNGGATAVHGATLILGEAAVEPTV